MVQQKLREKNENDKLSNNYLINWDDKKNNKRKRAFKCLLLFLSILPAFLLLSCQYDAGKVKETEEEGGVKSMASQIKINYDTTYQTVEGFGASGCWWAQDVGGWENISEIMEYLYDNEKGIGLNIYRYNIGAGGPTKTQDPWRRTQTVEVSPGVYDLERDKNAITALKEAVKYGADTVVLFANSPPARLTKSGYTSGEGSGKSNLAEGKEQEFAKYLVDITELILNEGIPVKYLSPINEPQWDWKSGQEGCHYEPDEVIKVAREVVLELEKRNLPVKISIPESGKWYDEKYTMTLYKKVMDDEVLSRAIDHWAVHSYWSDEKDKKKTAIYFSQIENMVPLHQTEWCEMVNGRDMGMDAALVMAKTIHEDMTILSVASWCHWLAVSCYDYRDGLIYVDIPSHKYKMAKRGWALGNYAKFIEHGYKRIDAGCEDNEILVSAYVSPKEDKTVIVAINPTNSSKTISFSDLKGKNINVYETSDNYNCELVGTISKTETWNMPSRSVTTFVVSK